MISGLKSAFATCSKDKRFSWSSFKAAQACYLKEDYLGSLALLESLFDSDGDVDPKEFATFDEVFELSGWNLVFLRHYEELEELIEAAGRTTQGEAPGLLLIQAWAKYYSGQLHEVVSLVDRFLRSQSDPIHPRTGSYLMLKSAALMDLGDLSNAIENAEIAYSLLRFVGNKEEEHRCGNYLGMMYRKISDYRESLKWYERVYPHYLAAGQKRKLSMVKLNMGVTYYKIGDLKRSISDLRESLDIGIEGGWVHRQVFPNIALGIAHRINRETGLALDYLKTAYEQAVSLGFPHEEALALEALGDVYNQQGDFETALRFLGRAESIAKQTAPRGDVVVGVARRSAECFLYREDYGLALKTARKAVDLATASGDRFERALSNRVIAGTAASVGDLSGARDAIKKSCSELREIGARHEYSVSLIESAKIRMQEAEEPRILEPRISCLTKAWDDATEALSIALHVDIPWWTEQARNLVRRVSAARNAQERADREAMVSGRVKGAAAYAPGEVIIHQSRVMRDMLQLCDMFATTGEPVLITGETGTGKEVVARRLHQHSDRAEGPLVVVNVTAIPDTMFEREFFGHVRGAFSGADRDGEGFASRAHGGTLFLDEIGDLPLELQPKLLRLLQEGTYRALGDPQQRHTDIRLVAATNANLERKVKEGTFRADLYYRLRILDLPLPPVRERMEDILPLMRHFLGVAAGIPVDLAEYFDRQSQADMEYYDWPGNVREIAMVARQAHVGLQGLGRVEIKLRRAGLPDLVLSGPGLRAAVGASGGATKVAEVAAANEPEPTPTPAFTQSEIVERARILVALEEAGGARNEAAKALGIGRSTLYRKMEKFGIPTRKSTP